MRETEIIADYELRANAERATGGKVEINRNIPYVSVTRSDGSEYFFQGDEADELINEADNALDGNINAYDYVMATSQSW